MSKIYIFNKETKELIKYATTQLQAYRFRYYSLSRDGIDTYIEKEKKVKTPNNLLDESCEKLWKKILLYDADYKCENSESKGKLNCHHIITRSVSHLRWCLENGIVLNASVHTLNNKFSAHLTPIKFKEWLNKYRGEGYYEDLSVRASIIQKTDLKMTYIYLKNEAKSRGI